MHAFEIGTNWALQVATPHQVACVAALAGGPLQPSEGYETLAKAILGNASLFLASAQALIEELFEQREPSHAALLGFIEAVNAVHKETLRT